MSRGAASDDGGEGDVVELNGLLQQPVEEQAAVVGAAPAGSSGNHAFSSRNVRG